MPSLQVILQNAKQRHGAANRVIQDPVGPYLEHGNGPIRVLCQAKVPSALK